MGVRMRVNRSHSGNRRSHIKVAEPRLTKCECGGFSLRHRVCSECGKYRGRQVIDMVAKTERDQRRAKRREQTMREMGQQTPARDEEVAQETKTDAKQDEKSEK